MIVKAVSDFVANNSADRSEVPVMRVSVSEKRCLEYTRGEGCNKNKELQLDDREHLIHSRFQTIMKQRCIDRQTGRKTDGQTNKQIDRQTD